MAGFAIALGLLVALGGVIGLLRYGTLSWAHPYGCVAVTLAPEAAREAGFDGLRRAIDALVVGKRFDGLSVSLAPDDQEGFMLSVEGDGVEIRGSFPTQKEGAAARRFRSTMSGMGYELAEEDVLNEGMGERVESRDLAYFVPKQSERLAEVCRTLLREVYGLSESGQVFLSAWHSDDDFGRGLRWRRRKDRLRGIL